MSIDRDEIAYDESVNYAATLYNSVGAALKAAAHDWITAQGSEPVPDELPEREVDELAEWLDGAVRRGGSLGGARINATREDAVDLLKGMDVEIVE